MLLYITTLPYTNKFLVFISFYAVRNIFYVILYLE